MHFIFALLNKYTLLKSATIAIFQLIHLIRLIFKTGHPYKLINMHEKSTPYALNPQQR